MVSDDFVSFHWRFEESKCLRLGGELGLCFRTRRGVVKFDIAQLISTILAAADGRSIFLATDGRARRKGGLVDRFKREIAKVVHIVDITDEYKDGEASSMLLSELEQQICSLSKLHIGSSMSSWDWEVLYSKFSSDDQPALFNATLRLERGDSRVTQLGFGNKTLFIDIILEGRSSGTS